MEYKKITEVELIEEPSEGATVLVEDNEQLRRVPFKKVGGGSGSSGGGGAEAVWFNLDYKTMGATCNYTYDQVAQMLDGNVSVSIFAHMHTPDGNMRMFCVNIHYITSMKMMFYFGSAVGNMNLCLTWNPDETISVEMIENEA